MWKNSKSFLPENILFYFSFIFKVSSVKAKSKPSKVTHDAMLKLSLHFVPHRHGNKYDKETLKYEILYDFFWKFKVQQCKI